MNFTAAVRGKCCQFHYFDEVKSGLRWAEPKFMIIRLKFKLSDFEFSARHSHMKRHANGAEAATDTVFARAFLRSKLNNSAELSFFGAWKFQTFFINKLSYSLRRGTSRQSSLESERKAT